MKMKQNTRVVLLLACLVGSYASEPVTRWPRIVGGSLTTIDHYPFVVVVLRGASTFSQWCVASVLNNRSVLSAAHCTHLRSASEFRLRVGSSFASSGGTVYVVAQVIQHPNYNSAIVDNDINIMRTSAQIIHIPNLVQPVIIAPSNFYIPDNAPLTAIGWGMITPIGPGSEQLRHVVVSAVNQNLCQQRYGLRPITENMLCSGSLGEGGRDQCGGDSGGPILMSNVAVGVCSFGPILCGSATVPGVNARISRYTTWIQTNA